ncbi:unnamed protein product [Dovyalis caffra]|uniref:Uncharacterized protein n=1 Tax=Dovyalis caffra TaxID=77055 RepID=A0AAV1QVN9_9ROSI|nr:unnamed protein product [Dovyalis caffra]
MTFNYLIRCSQSQNEIWGGQLALQSRDKSRSPFTHITFGTMRQALILAYVMMTWQDEVDLLLSGRQSLAGKFTWSECL